jgi:hypothetical protein
MSQVRLFDAGKKVVADMFPALGRFKNCSIEAPQHDAWRRCRIIAVCSESDDTVAWLE